MTAGTEWVSAHMFHFGDLDLLVREAVAPAVRELTAAGLVTGQFFLRYWEGGQHVRLRLRPTEPGGDGPVRQAVREAAQAHFARHPSTAPFDPRTYRAHAAAIAHAEGLDRYDDHLRPSDSVEFIPYQREHRAYGDATCMAVLEQHFTESSALALQVVAGGLPRGQRVALGLAAVTITLAVAEPDLTAAAARFAAGGTELWPDGWAGDAYQQRREEFLQQTRNLWHDHDRTAGLLGHWRQSVETLRAGLEPLWVDGRCTPDNPGSPLAYLSMAVPSSRRTVPLILLRCAHLFCNRIGLDPATESEMSLLLARALTDLPEQWR